MRKIISAAVLALIVSCGIGVAQPRQPGTLAGCEYRSASPVFTLSNLQTSIFQCDQNGNLKISGTFTVDPAGLATAAKQDTGNTSLASIVTNTTGAATAANQTTWQSATGAAPPANATNTGATGSGATGGLLAGLKACDLHAKYDASDNGSITLITGVASRKVYVCGYLMATGGTATNLKLREGSDANCATNGADLTPAYQLAANDRVGMMGSFWTGLAVSTVAYYICINASAGNAHQAEIWYTIQ